MLKNNTCHGESWTEGEEKDLLLRFKAGKSLSTICHYHGRSAGGIKARLKKILGFEVYDLFGDGDYPREDAVKKAQDVLYRVFKIGPMEMDRQAKTIIGRLDINLSKEPNKSETSISNISMNTNAVTNEEADTLTLEKLKQMKKNLEEQLLLNIKIKDLQQQYSSNSHKYMCEFISCPRSAGKSEYMRQWLARYGHIYRSANPNQEDKEMDTTPVIIETVTRVSYSDISEYNYDSFLELIQREQQKLEEISKVSLKSKTLKLRKKQLEKNIETLSELFDKHFGEDEDDTAE
jgi:hypothetical protein